MGTGEDGIELGEESSLRIAGAWSGIVRVPIHRWSVADLRAEVSRVSGFNAQSINLISGGRNLKDEDQLRDLRIHANSRLLMTRVGREISQEYEKAERLERIRAAAEAMASRSNELSSMDEYDLSLTNQNGEALQFKSESDKKAVVMGLILHAKGRKLIQAGQYKEALDVLTFAEESFQLCDQSLIEHVDNLPFLQIDMVWCLFMLRDIKGIGVARQRLVMARSGLRRAHGPELERLRVLQGGFSPELAIYVRLELLEGVEKYYSQHFDEARISLGSAKEKFNKLQVPDESLAMLAEMGFSAREAKRGLRVSGQDVGRAAGFIMEQREIESQKRSQDEQRRKELREQKRYGRTKSGKLVDLKQLNALTPLGYDKLLIAEALKQTDNDTALALDILSNPVNLEALRSLMSSSTSTKRRLVNEVEVAALIQMGFSRERATSALESTGDLSQALEKLVSEGGSSSSSNGNSSSGSGGGDGGNVEMNEAGQEPEQDRDVEMEDEMAENVTGDPFEEYDLDVTLEGNAIDEYLVLLSKEN